MALFKCPECGREISDKADCCPGCGCPASEFPQNKQVDTRTEVERIADEIFWEKPNNSWENAKLLAKRSGITFGEACTIMGQRRTDWKKRKRNGEFPDTEYCPLCGSSDVIAFEDPGFTTGEITKRGTFISITAPSSIRMKCNTCRYKWYPKKKKRRA